MQNAIIKRSRVQLEERQVVCTDGAKSARLLEDQGVVHAIELVCSCGEVTVFEIEYADTSEQAPAAS